MTLFMNPGGENIWYPATNVRTLQFSMKDTVIPPDILAVSIVAYRRSVDLIVTVESKGYVYCGVFQDSQINISKI